MITLVGVGHVFDIKKQVRGIILSQRPKVVCVELDRGRFEAMLSKDQGGDAPLSYRLLALMQRFIARKYNVQVGEEMLTAAKTAHEINARLAFIDMEAEIFFQKVMGAMTFEERIKLLVSSFSGFFVRKKRIEKELKNYEANEGEYMEVFEKEFPSIKRVLVDERNAYMAQAIRNVSKDNDEIIAFIGDGHVEGIRELIGDLNPSVIRLRELRSMREDAFKSGSRASIQAEGEGNASVTFSYRF